MTFIPVTMFFSYFNKNILRLGTPKRKISYSVPAALSNASISYQKHNKEKTTQTPAKDYAKLLKLTRTHMVPLEFDDLLHVASLMKEENMQDRSSTGSAKPRKIIHIHSGDFPKRIFHIHQIYKQGVTEIHYYGVIPKKFK